jgi:GT2 family glycosyltransferase
MRTDNITIIVPTYKRPEICNRFLSSVIKYQPNMKVLVMCLDDDTVRTEQFIQNDNIKVVRISQRMQIATYKWGCENVNNYFPDTEILLITDDDVIFTEYTIFDDYTEELLNRKDTGLIGITRIINKITPKREYDKNWFIYKGGGWLLKKDIYNKIGGLPDEGDDEWSICLKTYIAGYKNYRIKNSYAYHKQGSNGGIKTAVAEGKYVGKMEWAQIYVDRPLIEYRSWQKPHKDSKPSELAKTEHKHNNIKIISTL